MAINEELERIKEECSAKPLTIEYLIYILSEKNNIVSYKSELLRKANLRKINLDCYPGDLAKKTANVLEKCMENGDSNKDDFVAKLSIAYTDGDMQKYKEKKQIADFIFDSLLDYYVLEQKGARVNARGTMKEILEGTFKEEKNTALNYEDELKRNILEAENKEKETEKEPEKEHDTAYRAKPVEHNSSQNHSVSSFIKPIKKSRALFRWFLAASLAASLAIGYSNKKEIRENAYDVQNILKYERKSVTNDIMGILKDKPEKLIYSIGSKLAEKDLKENPSYLCPDEKFEFAKQVLAQKQSLTKDTSNYQKQGEQ